MAVEKYRVSRSLQTRQQRINELQAGINSSLVGRFGPQAVQAVLVDMANASATNAPIRQILNAHGLTVNFNTPPSGTNSVTNGPLNLTTNSPATAPTNSLDITTNPPSH
jgi:hypothetical protein